jgi:carboxyl-terminal processing protease
LSAAGTLAGEPNAPAVSIAYSKSTAEHSLSDAVFSAVYGAIAERYLDSVTVRTLALEGLSGLTSIDPRLSISHEEGAVTFVTNIGVTMRYASPAPGDVKGWSALSTRIIGSARIASKAVAATSDEQIYKTLIERALTKLDRFSRYLSPEKADSHRARRRGSGGIGIEFRLKDGRLIITKLLPGSSARAAGLRVGDLFSEIDGVDLAGLTAEQVAARLRGIEGNPLTALVERGNQAPFRLRIERVRSIPPSVRAHRYDDILYVAITGFNRDTPKHLAEELQGHLRHTARGIVLDLRGNPGGLLQQSVAVADLFLGAGAILSTRGRHPASLQFYEAEAGDAARGVPVVVLVDGGSASGSEVVAAALAEQGRAVLVGTASYGKGTVQSIVPLPNDGELILTWSRMITPSGQILNGRGVVPLLCTSGIDQTDPSSLNTLIAGLIAEAAERPDATRDDCPAERHDRDTDIDVARRLLSEPEFFAKLTSLRSRSPMLLHRAQLDTADDRSMVAEPPGH